MTNHAIAALEFDASTSKRAQQHTFEFSLDAPGMVRVTNTEYDNDDPEDHSYLVNVESEGEVPVACECPAFEYQPGACKHMVAVAIRTPVLAAAIVRGREERDGGQPQEAI